MWPNVSARREGFTGRIRAIARHGPLFEVGSEGSARGQYLLEALLLRQPVLLQAPPQLGLLLLPPLVRQERRVHVRVLPERPLAQPRARNPPRPRSPQTPWNTWGLLSRLCVFLFLL